ncbi:hypothetical protein TeGR_g3342, partial [Tetraparma gracilis]
LKVFAKLSNPPMPLAMVFACVRILVSHSEDRDEVPTLTRKVLRNVMRKPDLTTEKLKKFDPNEPIHPKVLEALYPIVTNPKFSPSAIRKISESIGSLTAWIERVVVSKCDQLGWKDGKPDDDPVRPFVPPPKHVPGKAKPTPAAPMSDSSSDEEAASAPPPQSANAYVTLLKELQEEIASLKANLNEQGLISPNAASAFQHQPFDAGEESDGSTTSLIPPPPDPAHHHNPRQASSIHLLEESVRLDGIQRIVKISYSDGGSTVNFSAWDPANNTTLSPTTCPALFCDKITGYEPVELEAMPENYRRQK